MFKLNKGSSDHILELRMIIEVEAAALAAKRVKPADVEELKMIMDSLSKTENEKDSSRLDTRLHYKIAEITGN